MRWSQLRKQVEERFAPSVQGRVALHTAHYRHAHDSDGRAWIEIDGAEVATMCYFQAGHARHYLEKELGAAIDPADPGAAASPADIHDEAVAITRRAGVVTQEEFYKLLHDYLRRPIAALLNADDPITRALATLDSRVGKRRLRQLGERPDAHPLVRMCLDLRCEGEGIERT